MSLSSISRELRRRERDPEGMVALVRQLAHRDTLRTLIEMMLSDAVLLEQVAARSLRHANGFEKLVLIDSPGPQLRLHVWLPLAPNESAVLENAHNHRWGFATALLVGGYTTTTFVPTTGDSYTWYTYEPADSRLAYSLHERGHTDLLQLGLATLGAGSSYWTHPSVIHRVSLTDPTALTATLLIIEDPSCPTTDVFVPRNTNSAVVGDRQHEPLSAGQAHDALSSLGHQLDLW